jgi:hypothetical protein
MEAFAASKDAETLAHSFVEEVASLFRATMLEADQKWQLAGADLRLASVGLVGATRQIALLWTLSQQQESFEEVVNSALLLYLPFIPRARLRHAAAST